jgi:hypothetical protein
MSAKLQVMISTYYTITACSNEPREFKSLNQKNMWTKLHQKKCETCRSAPTIQMGIDESLYTEGEAKNYTNPKDRICVLNHVKRTFESN